MKAGTTVVPDVVDATQGVQALEDDGDCVKEAEVIEDAAICMVPKGRQQGRQRIRKSPGDCLSKRVVVRERDRSRR